jgi:hypothetical protein
MATPDYYLSPVDIKDSHILTKAVERTVNEPTLYRVPFAPLTPTSARKIKLRVKHIDGAGLASFKADNADTPIVSGSGGLVELFMELFLISEKEVLKESDLIALQSPDELFARAAAMDVLDKGVRLRKRNINRTKWMAWSAAKDELTVTFPDGTTIAVDYDLDMTDQNDWFSTSHLPTTSIAWSVTATADIIEDVYTWSKIIADDLGVDQSEVIMYCRTAVWRYMQKNTGVKGELSTTDPRVITPKMSEVVEILGIREIRIENDFYVTEGTQTKSYYLDEGHILLTGPDTVNGDPIMEVKDGPVVRVANGQLVVGNNPGALAEVYINAEAKTENVRVSTARLPVMNFPAAFVYADISP